MAKNPRTITCPYCKGTGKTFGRLVTCGHCSGRGRVANGTKVCPFCLGDGKLLSKTQMGTCSHCNGAGTVLANTRLESFKLRQNSPNPVLSRTQGCLVYVAMMVLSILLAVAALAAGTDEGFAYGIAFVGWVVSTAIFWYMASVSRSWRG